MALLALVVLTGVLVAAPGVADAGLGTGAAPSFPNQVALGQVGLPASITLSNENTSGNTNSVNTVCNFGDGLPCPAGDPGITLIPSCGQFGSFSVCAGAGAEPGVLAVSATGVGEAGTACAGMVFDIALIDPTFGQLRFTPRNGAHVELPGTGSLCRINFTFDVVRLPLIDQDPGSPGLQTAQIVDNTQWSGSLPASARGTTNSMTVSKASPAIATVASPPVVVGGQLSDTAVVSGRVSPAPDATVTFALFGPGDPACAGSPLSTSTVPLPADATTVTSASYTTAQAGVYRWVATYSGDASNNAARGLCGDAAETVNVLKGTPTIATTASPGVGVGGVVTDSVVVSGRVLPLAGATVTFALFGPDDPACSAVPVFTSTVPLAAEGTATSAPYTTVRAGGLRWVATYNGDANNNTVTGACGDVAETVVVSKASPTIATTASPEVAVGGTVSDTATLSGLVAPLGGSTVTFNLYGPDNATCAGAPVFTSTVALTPGGTATSAAYATVQAGMFRWVATYNGDANNNAVGDTCGVPAETVAVRALAPPTPITELPATGAMAEATALLAAALTLVGAALCVGARRRRPAPA
jgi:LPXTG-motif cell wall-anchored protein